MTIQSNLHAFAMQFLGVALLLWILAFPVRPMGTFMPGVKLPVVYDPDLLPDNGQYLCLKVGAARRAGGYNLAPACWIGKAKCTFAQFLREIAKPMEPMPPHVILMMDARMTMGDIHSVLRALRVGGHTSVFLAVEPTSDSPVLAPVRIDWIRTHVVD